MARTEQAEPRRSRMRTAATRLRRLLALLPVRFDDPRFWPRAALGLALRGLVLAGSFEPLRAAVTSAVVWTLDIAGVTATRLGPALFGVDRVELAVTITCTHLEVVSLLAPLCWDRSRSIAHNLVLIVGGGAAVVALAIPRIALAVGLLRAGVPWAYGHDGLLGVLYFALIALVLSTGAWTRPAARDAAPAAQ